MRDSTRLLRPNFSYLWK